MLGGGCRARVARGACGLEGGGRRGGGELLRFLSSCWRASRSDEQMLSNRTMIVAINGPRWGGQEHRGNAARRAARLSLPRHRRDVPRADLARARARRGPRRRGGRSARSPASIRSTASRDEQHVLDRRTRRVGRDSRTRGSTRWVSSVARHPKVREVMRERQRELGEHGNVVIEGRDIGTVVARARK